ncbi:MAG: VOC family protein [Candidatus Acidiferrales bacterium]
MPRMRNASSKSRQRKKPASHAVESVPLLTEIKPRRGIKMKHVSALTMVLAAICLLAYLAGRVDISAATAPPNVTAATNDAKEHSMFLGLRTVKYEVQDVAKAKEWYTKALGIPPYFDEPAYYVGYNVGGYDLGLVPAKDAATKRAAAGVAYWGVEDAHAAYKRLLDLGATPVDELQDVGGGMLAGEVRDPFGNVIGIIYNPQFKPGQAK